MVTELYIQCRGIIGLICRKNGPICSRKMCSFTMTTYTPTLSVSLWINWSYLAMNCLLRTLQIWPRTTFLFLNMKKSRTKQTFESTEEIVGATEAYFADLQKKNVFLRRT